MMGETDKSIPVATKERDERMIAAPSDENIIVTNNNQKMPSCFSPSTESASLVNIGSTIIAIKNAATI